MEEEVVGGGGYMPGLVVTLLEIAAASSCPLHASSKTHSL
jgi:hypothetical protein